jgi:hypothetical protein
MQNRVYMDATAGEGERHRLVSLVKMESVEVRGPLGAGVSRQVPSLSVSVEEGLRAIRDLAVKLLVPQPVVATAQTFFHRVKFHAALCPSRPFTLYIRCRSLSRLQTV